jgi:hypothetical protein
MASSSAGRTPTQLYDLSLRRLVESHLSSVAVWLDPSLAGSSPAVFVRRSTALVLPVVYADLLIEAGPGRLMHVEYETEPRASLVARMFQYRARIMHQFPDRRLTQHVIVLGKGTVRGHDDLDAHGFALDLDVVYLREQDPGPLLRDAALSPLAVLARGSPRGRATNLARAYRVISEIDEPDRTDLLHIADSLATLRLRHDTIDRIRKENLMSADPYVDFYRGTNVGVELIAEGRAEGRREGQVSMLQALLCARFGDQPACLDAANRLAGKSGDVAIATISAADTLAELLTVT